MRTPIHLLLPFLAGCHVFASGDIPVTCDDLDDCGTLGGGDSGLPAADPELTLSVGLALSMSDGETWLAGIYDPPDLSPRIEKGGTGGTSGAVAWSEDRKRLYVADGGVLYVYGPSEADIGQFALPTTEAIVDIQPYDQSVFLITTSWIIVQATPNAEPVILNDNGDGLDLVALTADESLVYVISDGDTDGPDLFAYDPSTDEAYPMAKDFDSNGARIGGDIFVGPDNTLMSCSLVGAIYSVDELLSGSADPTIYAFLETSVEDVITCGYDAGQDSYLVISASEGLFVLGPEGDEVNASLTSGGQALGGAYIY